MSPGVILVMSFTYDLSFCVSGSPNAPSRRDTTNSIVLSKVIDINDLVKIVSHCEEDPDALADEFEVTTYVYEC